MFCFSVRWSKRCRWCVEREQGEKRQKTSRHVWSQTSAVQEDSGVFNSWFFVELLTVCVVTVYALRIVKIYHVWQRSQNAIGYIFIHTVHITQTRQLWFHCGSANSRQQRHCVFQLSVSSSSVVHPLAQTPTLSLGLTLPFTFTFREDSMLSSADAVISFAPMRIPR